MQTIGERLEEARKTKGISIREAAEATKVRGDYLHKFESNQFDINLPDIYVRGFLRNYARYLGLNPDKIVNDFAALGHGTPHRPLSREGYGRMDISVSTSSKDNLDPEPQAEAEEGESDEENPATFKPRTGALPYVDKALLLKGGLLLAAVAALVTLVVLGARSFSSAEPAPGAEPAATVAAEVPQITFVALGTVRIKVVRESDQEELYQGTLVRGESRSFERGSRLLVTADARENLEVEVDGRRFPTGLTGYGRFNVD